MSAGARSPGGVGSRGIARYHVAMSHLSAHPTMPEDDAGPRAVAVYWYLRYLRSGHWFHRFLAQRMADFEEMRLRRAERFTRG